MNNVSSPDQKRELLRHTVATVAYRGGKAVRNAPASFAAFQAHEGVRTPGQILAHIGDLLDWALSMAIGKQEWHNSTPLSWEHEVERFFAALQRFVAGPEHPDLLSQRVVVGDLHRHPKITGDHPEHCHGTKKDQGD